MAVSGQHLQRREFLKAAGVAAVIVGYSTTENAWVTTAHADEHGSDFDEVPELDGQLLTDQASREARGTDLGLIIFNNPQAVLRPASMDDIVKMVEFCLSRGIFVAARGQGHATHGQAQVKAGLVIDMSSLQEIHEIGAGYAVVDGGCTWRQLLEAVLPAQTPPVLTGYIGLSIGGTLSMGGISGMAYNIGVQVQHALELTVVTGTGKVMVCSEAHNRKLFEHVLSGLGQCGIIVRAKVKLVPARARAANTKAVYFDVDALQADMRTLVFRNELDSIYAEAQIDAGSLQLVWRINVAKFYDGSSPPDMAYYMRDLHYVPLTSVTEDMPYLTYQLQVDVLIGHLRTLGLFEGVMHPWFDVFLPDSELGGYVNDVVSTFELDDVGAFGFVLLFPLLRSTTTRPLFRLPDEELVWLFDVLTSRNAPGYDADFAANKRARNNAWYEMARSLGGTRYPIGTMDFTPDDWQRHYGSEWRAFKRAKRDFDPGGILTPGPAIFGGTSD
jgi:FAD/FMN-containing dehydrogenase